MRIPTRPTVTPWLGEEFRRNAVDTAARAPAAIDPWHIVGAAGEPPYLNQWAGEQFGGVTWGFQFCKDGAGFVHMRGWAYRTQGSLTSGQYRDTAAAFVLPAGYRPSKNITISTHHALSFFEIAPNGQCQIAIGFGNGFATLDGTKFRV
jgi:hypothetical protein